MLKKITLMMSAAFVLHFAARAAYTPVALTGFNADVVANGTGAPNTSTTATLDDANPALGYVFAGQDYNYSGSCSAATNYLPGTGLLTSTSVTGLTFQLASYAGYNALHLTSTASSGTLSFVTPTAAGEIYIVANSGAAASTVSYTINFSDGTTQTGTLSLSDWYGGSNVVVKAARVNIASTSCGVDFATNGPNLYQYMIAVNAANYSKTITSIAFTRTSTSGYPNIMGITVNPPCAVPAAQPTGLSLSATSTNQITGTFTAASPVADNYLVVRYATGATPTPPVTGTVYTAGNTLGTGVVIQAGAATSFTSSLLTGNTSYDYYIYAYNSTGCVGPSYNTTSPLTGTKATLPCAGPANVTIPVGTGQTFETLTAVLSSLSTTGISGPVILELQSNYVSTAETFPITFPVNSCISSVNTLTVRPATGATGLSISSANTTATIDFNGGSNILIDGRPGGTGSTVDLKIINTATAGVAIRFINDASSNAITYVDVQGQNTANSGALAGVICIGSTSGSNGNDNNFIGNNNIHATTGGTPAIAIYALGSTATVNTYNDNNIISANNIYDYFIANGASSGIKTDAGNNAWNITGNSFYQTASRTFTTANTQRGMWITPNSASISNTASNFQITNNYIGGTQPQAGGTAYTVSGSNATYFWAMDISVGLGLPTSIQGNIISNISLSSTGTSTTGVFIGVGIANGNVDLGTVTGNTIGSQTATGSITVTNGSGGTSFGIRLGSGNNINIANNKIGGINISGTSATTSTNFIGIGTGGGTTTVVNNNTIGSLTTANSISIAASSSATSQGITGINIVNGTTNTITNNKVANLTNNYTGTGTSGFARGINVSAGLATITGNTVFGLTNATAQTGSGGSASVVGIILSSTTAGATVSSNKIYSLKSTAASAAVNVVGMFLSGPTSGTNNIAKNFIHSLAATTTNAGAYITGMDIGGGSLNVLNNMVRVGIDDAGNSITTPLTVRGITRGSVTIPSKFFFNTVYVGGSNVDVASSTNTFAFQRNSVPTSGADSIYNNIFINARANISAAGSKHYAIYLNTNANNLSLNYNLYYVAGEGGVMGFDGTGDVLAYAGSWVASDLNSISADPQLKTPAGTGTTVDLHINTAAPTPIEGAGLSSWLAADDFDGDVRSALTPTDIGADAGNFTAIDISAPSITFTPFTYTCSTSDRNITATITDATGVPTTGSFMPRIYFAKSSNLVWTSAAGVLASGTGSNGTWNFTISSSAMGGVAQGEEIQYFIIAQDNVPSPNIGSSPAAGLIASTVNNVIAAPTTPNKYTVSSGITPGSVTINPVSATVCSTTGPSALLKASGSIVSGVVLKETFNAAANSWTTTNNSTNGTPANSAWTIQNSGYVYSSTTFTSNDASQFYLTNSDAQGTGGSTSTFLQSPAFSLVGFTTANLSFWHYFRNASSTAKVEVSIDGGGTWTSLTQYTTDQGSAGNFTNVNLSLSAYVGQPVVYIRFNYTASYGWYWAIDNVTVSGDIANSILWTPQTGLYKDAAATMPYTGSSVDSVYALPSATTTYTVAATAVNGCAITQTATVTSNCNVPVTLLSFTGERRDAVNQLKWVTATEVNNKGFELQRSIDGVEYRKIAFVDSKADGGNSTIQISYNFTDEKPFSGTNYYRLKQIDKDGKATVSNVVVLKGVKPSKLELTSLYPNPAINQLKVMMAAPKADKVTLVVTDATGKIVAQQQVQVVNGDNNFTLNVQSLSAGTYFLKAVCNDGCETTTNRFIKQ